VVVVFLLVGLGETHAHWTELQGREMYSGCKESEARRQGVFFFFVFNGDLDFLSKPENGRRCNFQVIAFPALTFLEHKEHEGK
jgi:hypothetical protein